MTHRVLTLQAHVLAGHPSVSGGVQMQSTSGGHDEADFNARVKAEYEGLLPHAAVAG